MEDIKQVPIQNLEGYGIEIDRIANKSGFEEELICCICQNIFVSPITCSKCENQFCTKCINEWTTTHGKDVCPNKCDLVLKKSPPITKGILSKLKIFCIFKENGCLEIIDYDQLKIHESLCEYKLNICNGCNKLLLQKDMKEHQQNCEELIITCEVCNFKSRSKEFEAHDKMLCIQRRLETMENLMSKMSNRIDKFEIYKENSERIITLLQTNNTCSFCKEIKRCKTCVGCRGNFCEDCSNKFLFCEFCDFNFDINANTLTGQKPFISNKKVFLKDGVLVGNKVFNKGIHQWNVKLLENGCTCDSNPSCFGIIKQSRLKNATDVSDAINNKSIGVAIKGYLLGMEGKAKSIILKEKYSLCLNFENNTFTITGENTHFFTKLLPNGSYLPFFGCCSGTSFEIETKHTFY